jgi:hypothetical protein
MSNGFYKHPNKASDSDLAKWIKYTNASRYKTQILKTLDNEALIHRANGFCILLPKGIAHVEKNISPELIV